MTGMEQGLRYIEREIRFMVKDQFGNPTYVKYADRVVEDTCGVPNFCSTVLSSKRPLTAILRAVRGPRGDIIARFFNSALHDTRIEMVMVLAEAIKLRSHNNRNSKNAHDYLMKLYRKAIKRMVRLITGSKNKESYKSMYRGLRDFARMDDYDYDDDDEVDEYFDNVNEFGDSEYAEACLDAYRDGKIPPEIDLNSRPIKGFNPSLTGNEEILKEIASIEAKLGRHLSDAELDKLLCGDDDDDDTDFNNIGAIKKGSDTMIDSIVDEIYNRLVDKFNNDKSNNTKYESLDDFIDREDSKNDSKTEVGSTESGSTPTTKIDNNIPKNTSTETLIGLHNRLKNADPNAESIFAVGNHSDDNEDAQEVDDSDRLPPSDKLGGTINEADFIDVCRDTDFSENDESITNTEYVKENCDYESTTEGLITTNDECPPHMQHMLILNDIINDCKLSNADITINFKNRVSNYFDRIGITMNDIFVSLVPSNGSDKLFTLIVTIRISGDYEIINMMHLNTVVLMHTKNIAERFGISEELIDTEFTIVDTTSTFKNDLSILNTQNKNFTPQEVDNLYSAMSAISAYIYKRIDKLIEVKFINSPSSKDIDVYFSSKDDEHLGVDFESFFNDELIGEDILSEIMTNFDIGDKVNYYFYSTDDDDDEFFNTLTKVIENDVRNTALISKYLKANSNSIEEAIGNFNIAVDEITHDSDISIGRKNLIIDIIYHIYTRETLNESHKDDLDSQLSINGEYSVQLESILRAICMNTEVSNFIEYFVNENDYTTDNEDTAPKTSNFGI